MAAHERTGERAEAEQHPAGGPRLQPLAEAARDEINQKDHMRHQPDGVEPVLGVKRAQTRDLVRAALVVWRRRRRGLARPAAPGYQGQYEGDNAEAEPSL